MRILRIVFLISLFAVLAICACSGFVFAERGLEIDYPDVAGAEEPTTGTKLPEYIKYIFNFALTLGGILAFAVLLFGGIRWLASTGSPEAISDAISWMKAGIMGLALLLSSYLIFTAINPDLAILELEELNPISSSTPPNSPPTAIAADMYQEIPIGLLIENILAKNISCFEYDDEGKKTSIIDCQSKNVLRAAEENDFHPDNHFNYCYKYDDDGNKEELLENHDRLDCINKLSEAIEIKSEELKIKSEELKIKSEELKIKSEELKNYANNCGCSNCSDCCDSSGCGSCSCNCNCSGDPCPDRTQMENLRNTAMPPIIDYMNQKRDEIWSFIYGADEEKYDDGDLYFYDIAMDTEKTPTFLTFKEGLKRLNALKGELQTDLDNLNEAESLTKSYKKEPLILAEYMDKKLSKKIDKNEFKGFNVSRYCREFNCITPLPENPEICLEYGLNETGQDKEGQLCDIYNLDGEPASFYYPK